MNFVDVQPKSFLDYAWTTPSSSSTSAAKPSKTSRKQNRCCDQCRKGKRACDAAILEDTLLDANRSSGGNPTVFHYSDVFGPLAPCGNCEKTKKNCTFEWLRSQRVSQATPQSNPAPPAKRRRTQSSSSNSSQNRSEPVGQLRAVGAPQPPTQADATTSRDFVSRCGPTEFGLTFADFPSGIPAFDMNLSSFPFEDAGTTYSGIDSGTRDGVSCLSDVLEDEDEDEDEAPLDRDSGQGSSLDTSSEGICDSTDSGTPGTRESSEQRNSDNLSRTDGTVMRIPRKRRRRSSSSTISNGGMACHTLSFTNNFLSSSNNAFLTEGLLKIYHDSFENALACWLTERTCPYSKESDVSLANDAGPDWNRIYHRVFRLDRLASSVRGRQLTFTEDKAAAKAINLAIFSFATQWAQSSQRSKAKYPFHSDTSQGKNGIFTSTGEDGLETTSGEFDRALQISAWHEARQALQNAAEIESFRVVLAQIVFSLTQKPIEPDQGRDVGRNGCNTASLPPRKGAEISELVPQDMEDKDVSECEDLLSKLNLTIEKEGPPIHLEQGLRLIHSLRSRIAMSRPKVAASRCGKPPRPSANRLDAADRATVDLLFWLGVMFDTLSSAMHKRPLVVSDEDSDIYSNEPRSTTNSLCHVTLNPETHVRYPADTEGLWDEYLFARQRKRLQGNPVRWPCTYDQAASLLCDAAPVKVLLFRKVTRIQTLLARSVRGERIEKAIKAALDVYDHWGKLYAPFIRDCINNHDHLPSRVQSWYICLTGHWHLATLLLADLVEIIDGSELSIEIHRQERVVSDFVSRFRQKNCHALSDLARCACPREDASFPKSRDFHFAVNQGALLTEPWTAVLIRAFAKAGVVLLESEAMLPEHAHDILYQEESFRRADDCVKALWYLGRKSDMALSAAKILGEALKERRKGAEEKLNDMSSFLEAELWEGFEEMNGAFGLNACEG